MIRYLPAIFISTIYARGALAMSGQPGRTGQAGGGGLVGLLVPMVIVFAIFYLLLIRPQQKQQKKTKAMLESVKRGDDVITRGGIHGRVTNVADNIITLEIANNVNVKINKEYIGVVKGKENPTQK